MQKEVIRMKKIYEEPQVTFLDFVASDPLCVDPSGFDIIGGNPGSGEEVEFG